MAFIVHGIDVTDKAARRGISSRPRLRRLAFHEKLGGSVYRLDRAGAIWYRQITQARRS